MSDKLLLDLFELLMLALALFAAGWCNRVGDRRTGFDRRESVEATAVQSRNGKRGN